MDIKSYLIYKDRLTLSSAHDCNTHPINKCRDPWDYSMYCDGRNCENCIFSSNLPTEEWNTLWILNLS